MGEAKRRRETDPNYGKAPEVRPSRGIVVSPPISIDGPGNLNLKTASLDPIEIRHSLLFWDRIAWPHGIISTPTGDDLQFLVDAGVLLRPNVAKSFGGGIGEAYIASQLQAYNELEHAEPGCWAMAQGERTLQIIGQEVPNCRELLVTLTRAIPIPDDDVPFEEILEFKIRRAAELVSFRAEIENLYLTVANSADPSLAMLQATERIESSCADLIRVNKEWKFGSLLSDLNFSFNLTADAITKGVATAFVVGPTSLDSIATILAGTASTLLSSIGIGKNISMGKTTPYRYVAHAHKELRF